MTQDTINVSVDKLPKSTPPQITRWQRMVSRFVQYRPAVFGLAVILVLIFIAVFAPQVARVDPFYQDYSALKMPPSAEHWLGTDALGRDVWARLVYATRVSISVGLVAVAIYTIIGTLLGAIAGYYGGWIDTLIMRLTDIVMTFPVLIIVITVVALIGPSLFNIMAVMGLLSWPSICRLVRGQILSLREEEFVIAARALGGSDFFIIFNHLLPNVIGPIVVAATFGIASAILTEASLSFLGLGVPPPQPSWGQMLTDAQKLTILSEMPWLWVPPGLMVSLTVLCVNFVGDGLRDALDPRTVLSSNDQEN
ncbi:MAG TPA: oligopeptide ABC transporter permease [Anaerolineales bacterium]|nr:oligopeptide ABC transporter permease [Anaerolineales bacterium]